MCKQKTKRYKKDKVAVTKHKITQKYPDVHFDLLEF